MMLNYRREIGKLADALIEELAPRVIKRNRNKFFWDNAETFAVAEVQRWQPLNESQICLTINLSGGSRFIYDHCPLGFKKFEMDVGINAIQARIGWRGTTGEWLRFTRYEDVDMDFRLIVKREIVPYFDIFSTDRSLFEWMRSDDWYGVPLHQRDRYLAAFGKLFPQG